MTTNRFLKDVVDTTVKDIETLLNRKGSEYAKRDDVFAGFKKAAGRFKFNNTLEVAMAYKLKHDISLEDMIDKSPSATPLDKSYVDEKINDNIAYLLLIKAMLYEREGLLESELPF